MAYAASADGDKSEKSKKSDETKRKKGVHKTALERFAVVCDAETDQRDRELEHLRFVDDPEGQWPEEIRSARRGATNTASGKLEGARPCLTIDKTTAPIQQVVAQGRNSKLSIQIKAKAGTASKAKADVLQGLIRTIDVDSNGHAARMWGFERAVKCGRGYYRVLKTYANDGDFDLDLVIKRILNQHSVYLDPFHQEPDGSDAEWAFITDWMPWDRYKRLYPKSKLAGMDLDKAFDGVGDEAPKWVTGDDGAKLVQVAEYFYVEHTTLTIYQLVDGGVYTSDDVPEGYEIPKEVIQQQRDVDVRKVCWCTINGKEILDEEEWEGRYIPIIQIIGNEANLAGERSYSGIVMRAMDPQRSFNYMRSAQVEAVGLAPRAPWVVAAGQIDKYKDIWATANIRNWSTLPYTPVELNGRFAPAPARNVAEPAIQAITLGVREADNDLKSTTTTFDPSLGNMDGANRSGKAILALQSASDLGKSNYLENLANVSMVHEGRILLDMIPYVYDRPGRVARLLGIDDEEMSVMLNAPFIEGPNKEPLPAPEGQPLPPTVEPDAVKTFTLSPEDRYSVVVSIGKASSTRNEAALTGMTALSEAAPGLVPLYADKWVEAMDFPGSNEIAERIRNANPALQGENGKGPKVPPEVQAQMAQMAEQNQQLMMALQEAKQKEAAKQQEIEGKVQIEGLKAQADVAKTEAELASKERIAQAQLSVQAASKQAELAQKQAQAQLAAEIEALKLRVQSFEAERDRSHEQGQEMLRAGTAEMRAQADHERNPPQPAGGAQA